jgi:predicted membrane channel-forming protein YqfA (hemolysin III family)
MTKHMAAAWRRLVGIALLWVALAALFRMSRGDGAPQDVWISLFGFACFVLGLSLFADGFKRSIVADLPNAESK